MPHLALQVLGGFRLELDGQAIAFSYHKATALLTYLAVTRQRHTRATLAALLWPDYDSTRARGELRRILWTINKSPVGEWLEIDRQTVYLPSHPDLLVDVEQFRDLLAISHDHQHLSIHQCDECIARLAQAVELYRGEFLAGFGLSDTPTFEDWLLHWREVLNQQAVLALTTLSTAWETRGDLPRANILAGRVLQLDPYHEESHQQKMRILSKLGMAHQAVTHYDAYRLVLKEELGVEPIPATAALAAQIRAGTYSGKASTQGAPFPRPQRQQSSVPETGQIYGRQDDIARLHQWLTQDRCRLIALQGMGGIGKTTLAAVAAHAAADQFDVVLWRSLINAPPLDELLRDWLNVLPVDGQRSLPESIDAQLAELLRLLHEQQCLLVLDNVETILDAEQVGEMRPGYEDYAVLLRHIGERPHASCLVLTSRELPKEFADMARDLAAVRSLQLEGLNVAAGEAMLLDRGLQVHHSGPNSLVTQYSGNPLALKLAAETVLELFGGNADAFLATEAIIFDDIRAVLDWQFDRLSSIEQEILIWLAVEREQVSFQDLRGHLTPPRPASDVLASLRDLRRRSLLEDTGIGAPTGAQVDGLRASKRFMLQNVVMEYLVERLVEAVCQEIEQEDPVRLHRHALIRANAKEYVRQSQLRLILQPIADRLRATLDKGKLIQKITNILSALRTSPKMPNSYAAGNLLNLLLVLNVDLTGYDLSHLRIRQADLRDVDLAAVDFRGADLADSSFADQFGIVFAVAYSPDGSLVAAGTDKGDIRLWRTSDGRLVHSYTGHTRTVKSVCFSPDGTLLASAGEDGTVRLWNVPDNSVFESSTSPAARIMRGHEGRVTAVAFHPDGRTLASGSVDQTVRLWDVATGEAKAILHGHDHWVWALAFHPDGTTLASGSFDRSIRLWDLATETTRMILHGHDDFICALAFSGNGTQFASGSLNGMVRLWDIATGQTRQVLQAPTNDLNCLAMSSNGDFLAWDNESSAVQIWDVPNSRKHRILQGHDSDIMSLAFSRDGDSLVSGSSDQSVAIWDLPTGQQRHVMRGHSLAIRSVAWHPNGQVFASAHYDHVVRLWDVANGTVKQTLRGHTQAVQTVTFSRSGAWLACGSDDHTIQLWAQDAQGYMQRRHVMRSHHRRVGVTAFSPNETLLVSGGGGQQVCVWDVAGGRLHHLLSDHEVPVNAAQFSPVGSLLAIISGTQNIHLWDVQSMRLLHLWRGHRNIIQTVAFSPDGRFLATGGGDSVICLWDVETPSRPTLHATLEGHTDRILSLAFSTDGAHIVSGSADRTIRVWEMQTYRTLRVMEDHTHWVWSVAISPDGNQVVSGGLDEEIRLWATETGECLARLTGPGPYANMNIRGVRGISDTDKMTLIHLGAVED